MESVQSKGGLARAAKLSPERRRAIAEQAANVRWSQEGKPGITKTFRIDAELWLWIVNRASSVKTTPNGWLIRCIKDAKKRVEAEAP